LSIGGRLYRFHASRPIEGTIKTVTIKRLPTGRMMVCFSCVFDQGSSSKTLTGHSVGFDFGLSQFLTGSDGTEATGLWAP
jgi:putative transposase